MTIPVLWLCGPPGVGKTAVGWALHTELVRSGVDAAYVDIDQLGICYPEPADDPGRHLMKARNLAPVVANFQAAGVRCVVVSGVVDSARGVPEIPLSALTLCRLRADHEELVRRYLGRGDQPGQIELVRREAEALDASTFADFTLDTSGLTVDEVVRQLRARWPGGQVLWLCGATGAGKSAVGFEVYRRTLGAGHTAAYVDLDQLGFSRHEVRERNLAALWQTYREAGAERLVVVGPALDPAITPCRLHAGRTELIKRIMLRGQGEGWPQPGDPLVGLPEPELLQVAERAVAEADALERAAVGLRVDTDGLTVEEVADAVVARTGWLLLQVPVSE